MRFHSGKIKKMKKLHIVYFIILFSTQVLFSITIPEKPNPPRLVNDFASMLTSEEVNSLENKLVDYGKKTTTQIVVVIVNNLNGEDKSMVATEIGQKWGVGQKGFDNGIVLLIKEKTADSKGEVFIATGYGLEGVIPDATAKLIVENEIIPYFKQGNYFQGIDNALNILMKLSLGEFTAKDYNKNASKKSSPFGALFAIAVIFFIIINFIGGANNIRRRSIGRHVPFWLLLTMLGSGSRQSGSFGNFSSGSGGFSGGGGFGGFGGGGFGGGGAGGSW
jgi:uncharacterized protein